MRSPEYNFDVARACFAENLDVTRHSRTHEDKIAFNVSRVLHAMVDALQVEIRNLK